MRDMIIGWVLATFHLAFPALYNIVVDEVEQVFENNNITSRRDKIELLSGSISPLADWVIEFHNNNPWIIWRLPLVDEMWQEQSPKKWEQIEEEEYDEVEEEYFNS